MLHVASGKQLWRVACGLQLGGIVCYFVVSLSSIICCFREANANIILGLGRLNSPFYMEAQLKCGLRVTVGPPKGFADLQGF
jgi:hypothetical protein